MKSVHADPNYAAALKDMQSKYTTLKIKYRAHSAILPAHRNQQGWWKKRQSTKNKQANSGGHDLLFIGDSITQGWEGAGKETWEKYYGKRKTLNLGFSGDRTEHVIYRLEHGNLRKQENAKVAVIMIGTNNTGHSRQDPTQTADGVQRILSILRARCPDAKVLLLSVFPRGRTADDPLRKINNEINKHIAKFHDGKRVHFLDISGKFLDKNGVLTKEIMPDALHPKQKGYQIWAEAIEPSLKKLGID